MTAIVALSYPGVNYVFYRMWLDISDSPDAMTAAALKMMIGTPFSFPEVWHTVAYASSIFIFIPAIVVIMFITNEYTYKTHRQNIIDGWSRRQFMTAKMIDVLIITLLTTLIYVAVALSIGFLSEHTDVSIWQNSKYIYLFFLQTFSQLSIAFLIAFLIRKAFLALGIFLFYKMILENIFSTWAKFKADDIGRFAPFEISNRLIPLPTFLARMDAKHYEQIVANVNQHIFLTLGITALTWGLCFWLNNKRDL